MLETKSVLSDMSIDEFCRRHLACSDGRKWAAENCETMQDVWRKAPPEYLLWVASREGVLPEATVRILVASFVFPLRRYLTPAGRQSLRLAVKYSRGRVSHQQFQLAYESATWPPADCPAEHLVQLCDRPRLSFWFDSLLVMAAAVYADLHVAKVGGSENDWLALRDKLFLVYVERVRTYAKPSFRPYLVPVD